MSVNTAAKNVGCNLCVDNCHPAGWQNWKTAMKQIYIFKMIQKLIFIKDKLLLLVASQIELDNFACQDSVQKNTQLEQCLTENTQTYRYFLK